MPNKGEIESALSYSSPVRYGTSDFAKYGGITLRDDGDGKDVWDVVHDLHEAHGVLAEDYQRLREELAALKLLANQFMMWFEKDGQPVDGFRFRDQWKLLHDAVKHEEWMYQLTAVK